LISTRAGRLLLFCAALAFAGAAWLFLRPTGIGGRPLARLRLCVVDASASVRRTRPDWLPWVRARLEEEARGAASEDADFAVVSFASDLGFSFPRGTGRDFLAALEGRGGIDFDPRRAAGSDARSRLADALALARAEFARAPEAGGTLVLIGVDRFEGEDPRVTLAHLRASGVDVRLESAPPQVLPDLGLRSLRLSDTVEPGAPIVAEVELFFSPGRSPTTRAWLDFEVEGRAETLERTFEVELTSGTNGRWMRAELGAADFGRTEARVRARLDPAPDPIPENDRASASTRAEGALVLAVLADEDRLADARRWLAASGSSQLPGLQFLFRIPGEAQGCLGEVDAVVSFDLEPGRLPRGTLGELVRSGGGWLATGGWRFLKGWVGRGPASPLEGLLPVEPAPSDAGPRDVVLLVDGSGSMEGAPFDTVRAACKELISFARPEDEVSLRFFTARLESPILLKERDAGGALQARAKDTLEALFGLRLPRGDTEILTSLEALANERRSAAREALVLLFSDGREGEEGAHPDQRIREILAALGEWRARLRVIAIGEQADTEFLARLLPPGEEIDRPRDLAGLEEVLRREMSGSLWKEGPGLRAVSGRSAQDSLAVQAFPDGGVALPALERMLRVRPKPGAETPWTDEERSPLLVLARAGLGRVAFFASNPEPNWAGAWTGRSGLGEPAEWGPLLRWLARRPARARSRPALTLEGRTLRLSGVRDWPPSIQGRVFDRDGVELALQSQLRFDLPARVEGPEGIERRESPLPEDLVSRGDLHLVRFEPFPRESVVLPLPQALADEFEPSGPVLARESLGEATASPARARRTGTSSAARSTGVALLLGLTGALLLVRGVRRQAGVRSFR